jgi:uncharacterized membrane protein YedE/YeeE
MLTMFPEAQPVEGLISGLLIGISSALMLLGAGRIAGISGLASRAIGLSRTGTPWPMAALFMGGLLLGAFLFQTMTGPIEAHYAPSTVAVIAAGLLTGFGTRMGSGCTSGHGVCGMSRLSPRSLIATITFIASGMVTVAIVNALGGGWS